MNEDILHLKHNNGTDIVLVKGDITEEKVDAIVNAANSMLLHGGGVAGAIVRKGGNIIQEESNRVAPVSVGNAGITGGGKLPADYVIHAVGPRWGEGDEHNKLAGAVRSSLLLANEKHLKSISLPAISTGIFGFPLDEAVDIILGEIKNVLDNNSSPNLEEIRLCIFDDKTLSAFTKKWGTILTD